MNRSKYFDYIDRELTALSSRIQTRGRVNLLDLHIHSENFFAGLMNILLHVNLKNINAICQNTEGIDLIDENNKIIAQVSSTCTKQKIETSLVKSILNDYTDFRFLFIAITGDATKLRNSTFRNPYNVKFLPNKDIYDIAFILEKVLYAPINDQRTLFEFIKSELGRDIDMVKVDTNLASIINILSKENFNLSQDQPNINSFEILRKIEFNDLLKVQPTIEDYKIFYRKLDEKYREFDKLGSNRSLSVFSVLKRFYIQRAMKSHEPYEIFYSIIDDVVELITKSNNYIDIPYEELEMCASILVVDAFIRCKIFKNPEGYTYVVT